MTSQWANFLISLFILFWSDEIGDEEFSKEVNIGEISKNQGSGEKKSQPRGSPYALDSFKVKKVVPLDKKIFLSSFTRQSRLGLMACLERWQPSPYRVILSGRVYKAGIIKNIKRIDSRDPLPQCVHENIEKMDFKVITTPLPKFNWQTVQWEVRW